MNHIQVKEIRKTEVPLDSFFSIEQKLFYADLQMLRKNSLTQARAQELKPYATFFISTAVHPNLPAVYIFKAVLACAENKPYQHFIDDFDDWERAECLAAAKIAFAPKVRETFKN